MLAPMLCAQPDPWVGGVPAALLLGPDYAEPAGGLKVVTVPAQPCLPKTLVGEGKGLGPNRPTAFRDSHVECQPHPRGCPATWRRPDSTSQADAHQAQMVSLCSKGGSAERGRQKCHPGILGLGLPCDP